MKRASYVLKESVSEIGHKKEKENEKFSILCLKLTLSS